MPNVALLPGKDAQNVCCTSPARTHKNIRVYFCVSYITSSSCALLLKYTPKTETLFGLSLLPIRLCFFGGSFSVPLGLRYIWRCPCKHVFELVDKARLVVFAPAAFAPLAMASLQFCHPGAAKWARLMRLLAAAPSGVAETQFCA